MCLDLRSRIGRDHSPRSDREGPDAIASRAAPHHSADEERFITIGQSASRLLVVVIHADRDEIVRIIRARRPTLGEKKKYAQGQAADR